MVIVFFKSESLDILKSLSVGRYTHAQFSRGFECRKWQSDGLGHVVLYIG